jgi:nucleoside-diphosphate-sugar epimerase
VKGLNTKIFRPHNIYGENMGLEHVIPEIVSKIVAPVNPTYEDGKLVVNIQGTGQETRSFCYIDDAIDQMVFLGTKIEAGCSTYNVGVENEISIYKLVQMIAKALGTEIIIRPGKKQEGSSNRRCPSLEKTRNAGYMPNSDLRAGIEKTVKWYKEKLNG